MMTDDNFLRQEMAKPRNGKMSSSEWFYLFSFLDFAFKKDEMFASAEDQITMRAIVTKLHDQVFPAPKDATTEFAESLQVAPKKILTGPTGIVV